MRKLSRFNEEIARWAFEILFDKNIGWKIAFTNPTAGPWKTIRAASKKDNTVGEVYRFILEEERPDIIMYNDDLRVVLIFEAKDELRKLLNINQASKSSEVVIKLARILKNKSGNEFWKGREDYKIILSLLWGAKNQRETTFERNKLFDFYHKFVGTSSEVFNPLIIGIETLYFNGQLSCSACYKNYSTEAKKLGEKLVASLLS